MPVHSLSGILAGSRLGIKMRDHGVKIILFVLHGTVSNREKGCDYVSERGSNLPADQDTDMNHQTGKTRLSLILVSYHQSR